jgi:hypothetical protein
VVSWKEAFRFQRGFGDAKQHGLGFGGLAAFLVHALVLFFELQLVHLLAPQEVRVAGFRDADLAEHLADDDLDVLVVNGDTLQAIDFLDFVDEVLLELLRAADVEDFVRVNGALGELLALLDIVALEDDDVFADGDEVFLFDAGLLVLDQDAALALVLEVLRGVLAISVPATILSPSATTIWAPDGIG